MSAAPATRRSMHPALKAADKCIAILDQLSKEQAKRTVAWLAEEYEVWPEQTVTTTDAE